jgi:DNA-binding response OmpR family regulator
MRLLLVEDDTDLVASLKPALQDAGFAVDVAEDGIDAEYLGNEKLHDIVVLDLGLPGRNGLEVLKNWRHDGNSIPVIILTARDNWLERIDGFKAGADDYLGKPFHVEELVARINAVLHRLNRQTAGTLEACGLVLDEERQVLVTPGGDETRLTGTEFRLLRYMMMHPNRVLPKSRLSDHIYEFDDDRDSNVIEVYIKRLRKLLGRELIETRRGQGYVLRCEE